MSRDRLMVHLVDILIIIKDVLGQSLMVYLDIIRKIRKDVLEKQ